MKVWYCRSEGCRGAVGHDQRDVVSEGLYGRELERMGREERGREDEKLIEGGGEEQRKMKRRIEVGM